jgi:hypothetical protein
LPSIRPIGLDAIVEISAHKNAKGVGLRIASRKKTGRSVDLPCQHDQKRKSLSAFGERYLHRMQGL